VLELARKGIYDSRSVRDVPSLYLKKYFSTLGTDRFAVKTALKDICSFEHMNLMDRKTMRQESDYDFVFCRNVLIYFDDLSRKQVVERFYSLMNRGAFIFLGHSESMSRISAAFKVRKMNGYIIYQK
jgi:chemotaxis protein methyltransferase CheR